MRGYTREPHSADTPVFRSTLDDDDPEALARRIVGALLVQSQATFDAYASDLIFDYHWLVNNVVNGDVRTFHWAHRSWGTHIGTDVADAVRKNWIENALGLYRVDIVDKTANGWTTFTVTITKEETC